jgi:hypothetical protein
MVLLHCLGNITRKQVCTSSIQNTFSNIFSPCLVGCRNHTNRRLTAFLWIYTYTYVHMHIYIHICTYAYICTHIQTQQIIDFKCVQFIAYQRLNTCVRRKHGSGPDLPLPSPSKMYPSLLYLSQEPGSSFNIQLLKQEMAEN